ncbi:hypothetical protein HPSA_04010 [Helicobacter pylori SouthAfrica7]|uniref:Uncharacterized protein n=1 Tax=Helicobacter pylori (strain SouthAfrica7) TaxID=907239 RepID=E8QS30_HELPW|nr:hypothetical protein HPSA_04010 [Helicobacter pylori SouthAfrica7]
MSIDNKIQKNLHKQAVILKSVIRGSMISKITPYPFKSFTINKVLKTKVKIG